MDEFLRQVMSLSHVRCMYTLTDFFIRKVSFIFSFMMKRNKSVRFIKYFSTYLFISKYDSRVDKISIQLMVNCTTRAR